MTAKKQPNALSDIVIILDRSGSMEKIWDATVQGISSFIREVRETPGEGCWTLVLFDDYDSARGASEEFPLVSFSQKPDSQVEAFESSWYRPRGGTALIDAVCMTINKTKGRLEKIHELFARKVLFVIVTDGQENQSREYTSDSMRALIAEMQSKYGWDFIYLGANQDAFAEARKHGLAYSPNWLRNAQGKGLVGAGAANAYNFEPTSAGVLQCLASGAIGARLWKADGNPTAESFVGSALRDVNVDAGDNPVSGG